ncbi:hypothetical protein T121_23580 [Salmonella enterica subsp. enterica serovar Enteritidis]|nr:hypothetical protein [Salmonella enterica subsp. enterica serovar Enteritidis]
MLPGTQTPYLFSEPLDNSDILQICYQCHEIGGSELTRVNKLLWLIPEIELPFVKPSLWRRGACREAYMLSKFNINLEKVWEKMNDTQTREQITHTLELHLAMKRLGLEHEGLESVINQWVKRNR